MLGILATEADRSYLLDDLEEQFRHVVDGNGYRAARRWYRRHALLSLLPMLRRRLASIAAGVPAAFRSFGDLTMNDLRHSLRLLRKNVGSSTAAILTLVIGITLSATIFSIVDWLWLSASPFAEPEQIVRVFAADREGSLDGFSYPDFEDLRAQTSTLEDLTTVQYRGAMLASPHDGTTRLMLADVTARNFFDVLGIRPAAGTLYHAGDDLESAAGPGVVISYSLWEREFGLDPDIVGRPVSLSGRSHPVLGVAPRGFAGLRRMVPADIWYPVESWGRPSERSRRDDRSFYLLGRIDPNTDLEQVHAEVGTIMGRLDIRNPATRVLSQAVVMTDAAYQARNYGGPGTLLLALVGAVLLIACANVAGLQMARALVRQREMAVRMALGGNRTRLIRQLLVEGLVLSAIAAAVSLVLSGLLLDTLPAVLPAQPTFMEWGFALDARVVTFTVALALATALLFSLLPALRASRPGLMGILKGNDISVQRSGRPVRSLNVLVVVQLALSLVLISTTALLLRSFLNTQSAELGMERKDVLVSWIIPQLDREQTPLFYADLVARTEALPGVQRATMARHVPFFPSGGGADLDVYTTDAANSTLSQGAFVKFNLIGSGYFDILGIPVRRGRPVTDEDRDSGPRVAVINETMAARIWPGEDPVGRTFYLRGPATEPVRVVGVVVDGKYNNIEEEPEPYLYLPFTQIPWGEVLILAETEGDPTILAPAVRDLVRILNPDAYLLPQTSVAEILRNATYNRQLMALALGVFALIGVLLALVGLYGVSAFAVNRRMREIGIRMALGANSRGILRLALRQGGRLIITGMVLGIPIAVTVGILLRGSLFGVSPVEPLSLAGSATILGLVMLVAVLLPSRRAVRVDPLSVMRQE